MFSPATKDSSARRKRWIICGVLVLVLLVCRADIFAQNSPPVVQITGWGGGPYSISPCAYDANDPDGFVTQVEFFGDGASIGIATNPPYCVHWENVPLGFHTVFAIATDNMGATGTSAPVTIEIVEPLRIEILTPTNGQSITAGEQVSLSASITGGRGPRRVLYHSHDYHSYNGIGGFLARAGSTNAPHILLLTNLSLGEHRFHAEVSDSSGTAYSGISSFYVLPIAGFPRITRSPTNQYVNAGTNVVLEVEATSSLPLQFQWLLNDNPIPSATNAALVISNFHADNVGYYCAQVLSAVGVTASAQAYVCVTTTNPVSVSFANFGPELNAPVEYGGLWATLWAGTRSDALFPIATTNIVTSGGSKGYFSGGVRSIPFAPKGSSVFCLVTVISQYPMPGLPSNLLKLQSDPNPTPPLSLIGLRFPYYIEWPEPALGTSSGSNLISASIGQDVELRVGVFSWSDVTYHWKRNGIEIPNASGVLQRGFGQPPAVSSTVVLRLPRVSFRDAASYSVVAQNAVNLCVSQPIPLNVLEPEGGRLLSGSLSSSTFSGELRGRLGRVYRVDHSSDLTNWAELLTATNHNGRIIIRDTAQGANAQFYRSILIQ